MNKQNKKSRGNGQGCVYKRGKSWTAQVVIGWRPHSSDPDKMVSIKRTKGGFATKAEAVACIPSLFTAQPKVENITLAKLFDAWETWYSPRVGYSTMTCYQSAFKHFAPLHNIHIANITAGDLQDCMDACENGKRTHQNMKCIAGLLWAYALDRDYVEKDITQNLYIGKGESVQRDPITEDELALIRNAVGVEPYADYVYALCYLGFRPGEFLGLRKDALQTIDGVMFLRGGGKTAAGKNRVVPVPDAIADIVKNRMSVQDTDLLFPRAATDRAGNFTGYVEIKHDYFNKKIFTPLMNKLGIFGKVPYCARHTYSDKLKNADADDRTKAAVIGHTDYAFTQSHYQSTQIEDLKKLGKSIK